MVRGEGDIDSNGNQRINAECAGMGAPQSDLFLYRRDEKDACLELFTLPVKTSHRFDDGKHSGLVVTSSGDYQAAMNLLKLSCSRTDTPTPYQFLRSSFRVDTHIAPRP